MPPPTKKLVQPCNKLHLGAAFTASIPHTPQKLVDSAAWQKATPHGSDDVEVEETEQSITNISESAVIRHLTDHGGSSPDKDVSKYSNSNLKRFFQQHQPPLSVQSRERLGSDASGLSANHKKAPMFVKAKSKH